MDWFRQHSDAIAVIAAIISSLVWMNGKFNQLEKDIAIIKTVLIMKNIMPDELACTQEDKR